MLYWAWPETHGLLLISLRSSFIETDLMQIIRRSCINHLNAFSILLLHRGFLSSIACRSSWCYPFNKLCGMRYRSIVAGDLRPAVEVALTASVAWRASPGCPLDGADSFRGCQDAVKTAVRWD